MNKKIILTLVLLIFAQQEFYGMKENRNPNGPQSLEDSQSKSKTKNKNSFIDWEKVDSWLNVTDDDKPPKLRWLWVILDNIHFQHGNLTVDEYFEVYNGLSNGFGFFPSFLNFQWIKIGIYDMGINIISAFIHCAKIFVRNKKNSKKATNAKYNNNTLTILTFIGIFILFDILLETHLFSFKIFNSIKIKLISMGGIAIKAPDVFINNQANVPDNKKRKIQTWYLNTYDDFTYKPSTLYMFLYPRIEINIAELINYSKEHKLLEKFINILKKTYQKVINYFKNSKHSQKGIPDHNG